MPTLDHIAKLAYAGPLELVLADNNSTDRTAELAAAGGEEARPRLSARVRTVAGKHHALNTALESVTTPLVVTVDADTLLHKDALTFLVGARHEPPAGPARLRVRGCARRRQLPAQPAQPDAGLGFPARDQRRQADAGGLQQRARGPGRLLRLLDRGPPCRGRLAGRDRRGHRADLDADGLPRDRPIRALRAGLHRRPRELVHFMRQRSRWARGMFESLGSVPPTRQPRVLAKFVAGIDYLVPFLDIGFIFFWIPGVILFLFGYPLLFSWWSML